MDHGPSDALLRLLLTPGMHSAAAARLLRRFDDDPARVLAAPREALATVRGVGPTLAAALAAAPGTADAARRERDRCAAMRVALVPRDAPGYPAPLRATYDPPPLLWVRGAWEPDDTLAVAVVGSRRPTPYGVVHAAGLSRALAARGLRIVSGLARGVDTAAHEGALEAPGGRTLAVMGSGHARPYPWENRHLATAVAERGAVLADVPLDTPPRPHHFPRRNRVLAALALGTLVIQAGERSGSLITARLAMESGREVLALPGRIDEPLSRGGHRLLRDGAALVEGPDDVVEALGLERFATAGTGGTAPAPAPPPGDGGRVWTALDPSEPRDADDLARATGLAAGTVRAALADLEIEGRVRPFPGGRWTRR